MREQCDKWWWHRERKTALVLQMETRVFCWLPAPCTEQRVGPEESEVEMAIDDGLVDHAGQPETGHKSQKAA